jgi:hypothetical protein
MLMIVPAQFKIPQFKRFSMFFMLFFKGFFNVFHAFLQRRAFEETHEKQ